MPVVTKNPTETIPIVAGWDMPENAFKKDGAYTKAVALESEQEYSGYGFNLRAGSKINKVVLRVTGKVDVGNERLTVRVWDGKEWHSYSAPIHEDGTTPKTVEVDVTSVLNSASKVNKLKVRIYNWQVTYI